MADTPAPAAAHPAPRLSVEGYEGPLDFLLEMVGRQRVDLGGLSILALTDQLVGAIEAGAGRIPLERRAEWLVMGGQLLLLKARLLAPSSEAEAGEAREAAARQLAMLDELARMRAGAAWLAARPQLGQGVFGRGRGEAAPAPPRAEGVVAFLEATLALLEGHDGRNTTAAEGAPVYRPRPPDLWRLPDALRRIAELLERHPAGLTLERCLPEIPPHATDRPLRLRAAMASTFVAGLEMTRDGTVAIKQEGAFDIIRLMSAAHDSVESFPVPARVASK